MSPLSFLKKNNSFSFFYICLLLLFLFLIGFAEGSITLMFPVRWAVDYANNHSYSESQQSMLVKIIIFIFLIIAFFTTVVYTKFWISTNNKKLRYITLLSLIVLNVIALSLWLNPSTMNGKAKIEKIESSSSTEFFFGPYPEQSMLADLKTQGYTHVVSLLHSAVIPFEPVLISRERKAVEIEDLELIEIPMLPWVSENEEAIKKLQQIAKIENGKIYIHCYLGKDRINVAKNIISKSSTTVKIIETPLSELSARRIDTVESFERGQINRLEESLYLTPCPTDEEFFSFVFNGYFSSVVCLLNPAKKEDKELINKQKNIFDLYKVNFISLPLIINGKQSNADSIVYKVMRLPKPTMVYSLFTASPENKEFVKAYEKQKNK